MTFRFFPGLGVAFLLAACGTDTEDPETESGDTAAPEVTCTEITLGDVQWAIGDEQIGVYGAVVSPDAGDPEFPDIAELQFFELPANGDQPAADGASTGTFELGDQYATSPRSVLIVEDAGKGGIPTYFFQSGGTLVVDEGSTQVQGNGTLSATLTDVTLVESTIDFEGTFLSEPVEGGRCLHLASATLDYEPGENRLSNGDLESFDAGADPTDPPSDFVSFGATLEPFGQVAYVNYGTVAAAGRDGSRALVTRGVGAERGGQLANSLGTVFQSFDETIPAGATLSMSGWAYVDGAEPLDEASEGYLFIKCFSADFSAEFCGGGRGERSQLVTSDTPTDTWVRVSASFRSLDARAAFVQAGVEFEQCAGGDCAQSGGAILWDDLQFTWE
ncbi:MAG: hypothetical protein AAF211_07960 [Myxococcota bacterium]